MSDDTATGSAPADTMPEPGEMVVHRSIEIAASPERVWREFTDNDRMRMWFDCERLVLEPRAGGHYESGGLFAGQPYRCTGTVLRFEPQHEVALTAGPEPPQWPGKTFGRFLLTPLDDGARTRVELYQFGFEQLGDQASSVYELHEQIWGMDELDALRAMCERPG